MTKAVTVKEFIEYLSQIPQELHSQTRVYLASDEEGNNIGKLFDMHHDPAARAIENKDDSEDMRAVVLYPTGSMEFDEDGNLVPSEAR